MTSANLPPHERRARSTAIEAYEDETHADPGRRIDAAIAGLGILVLTLFFTGTALFAFPRLWHWLSRLLP